MALVATLVLAACANPVPDSAPPGGQPDEGPDNGAAEDVGPAPAGLEQFYDQQLDWAECGSHECAQLTVPVSYQEPDGATIELELLRVPAGGDRIGSLVVNPGGPGGSGVDYAAMAGMVIDSSVRQVYDVVGFDPRGVGSSAPIWCVEDATMDLIMGADLTPDTPEIEAEIEQLAEEFIQGCVDNAGELLGHVSTVEAARDMDVLRAALGEPALDYYGASYGTFLGTTYATLFPDRAGRIVLDGAIDPGLSGLERSLGQAEGFERATRAYVEDCVEGGDCPLGEDVESALQRIPQFLDEVSADPLPVRGDTVTELTEGWAFWGIIVVMYDQAAWSLLSTAFEQAFDGNGSLFMFLANAYADRNADGTYNGNIMQVIRAVNCLDDPGDEQDLGSEEVLQEFLAVAPTWGERFAGESMCTSWPVQAQEVIEDYSAAGADPILVIGTTRDPATPYQWAQGLADTLESAVLISFDGDGHTAYGRSNDCVDDAVNDFLIQGTVPEDGLSC